METKVIITRELKVRLLMSIISGVFDAEKFPEFKEAYSDGFNGFSFLPVYEDNEYPDKGG
jgi:hypothetical protein